MEHMDDVVLPGGEMLRNGGVGGGKAPSILFS